MPDYKNTNGLIYTEEDIEALAKTANLSSEEYLSKHSKSFKPVGGVEKVEEEKEDPRWGEKNKQLKDDLELYGAFWTRSCELKEKNKKLKVLNLQGN